MSKFARMSKDEQIRLIKEAYEQTEGTALADLPKTGGTAILDYPAVQSKKKKPTILDWIPFGKSGN